MNELIVVALIDCGTLNVKEFIPIVDLKAHITANI